MSSARPKRSACNKRRYITCNGVFVLRDLSGWAEHDADESIGQRCEEARGAEEAAGKARGTSSAGVFNQGLMIAGREEGEGRQGEEGSWRICCCCCCCPCTTFGIEHAGRRRSKRGRNDGFALAQACAGGREEEGRVGEERVGKG